MPRKGSVAKRDVLPDPIYHSKLVTRLINKIMFDGKRGTSQTILYIYDGNILGIPENIEVSIKKVELNPQEYNEKDIINEIPDDTKIIYDAVKNGVPTNIRYIDALSAKTAYKIEEAVLSRSEDLIFRNTIARALSDVNLKLDTIAMNYINNENKLIDIRGPIFSTIKLEIK